MRLLCSLYLDTSFNVTDCCCSCWFTFLGGLLHRLLAHSKIVLRYFYDELWCFAHCTYPLTIWKLKLRFEWWGQFEQGTKRSNLGNSNSNGFGEVIFVDDEHKPTEDQPVPMSLEQTEPMHSELDQMVFYNVTSLLFILFMSHKSISKLVSDGATIGLVGGSWDGGYNWWDCFGHWCMWRQ